MDPIDRRNEVDAKEQAERDARAKQDQLKQVRSQTDFAGRLGRGPATPMPATPAQPITKSTPLSQQPGNAPIKPTAQQPQADATQAQHNRLQQQPPDPTQANAQSSAAAVNPERDAAGNKVQPEAQPMVDSETPTLPGIPPTPIQAQAIAKAKQAAGQRPLVTPEQLQEMVRYAAVGANAQGQSEFLLGLAGDVAGGLQVRLTALGQRRLKIRLAQQSGQGPADEQVRGLIEALRARGIEVVEVEQD